MFDGLASPGTAGKAGVPERENERLNRENEKLRQELIERDKKIAELKRKLALRLQNSSTSSKPLSSDLQTD
jgi:hypothetical protein